MKRENTIQNGRRAVALGLFDGVHVGHRKVIGYTAELEKNGLIPTVFTFNNETIGIKHNQMLEYIYSDAYKAELMKNLGICEIYSSDFNTLKDMNGEEFASEILVNRLNAGYVICGRDFHFGKNAVCGGKELAELGRQYGFSVSITDDVQICGKTVSSNAIRAHLKNGEVDVLPELLGDEYTVSGEVVYGNQIGRTLDFPTINQPYKKGQLVPKHGVYSSSVKIDGKSYKSVTNIGVKPTIEGERAPLAETHIIDYSGNLYGMTLDVKIKEFMRSEQKFSSFGALKSAVMADIEYCKKTNLSKE